MVRLVAIALLVLPVFVFARSDFVEIYDGFKLGYGTGKFSTSESALINNKLYPEVDIGWLEVASTINLIKESLFLEVFGGYAIPLGEEEKEANYEFESGGYIRMRESYHVSVMAFGAMLGYTHRFGSLGFTAKVGPSVALTSETYRWYYFDYEPLSWSEADSGSDSDTQATFGVGYGVDVGFTFFQNHTVGISVGKPHPLIQQSTVFWKVDFQK